MEIGASAADNGRASKEFIPTCTVSCAHAPASLLPPCPQARKGGGQMEKTHNTEGLGSENISMFFSNSIANKKGFLPRPARFRAWTGEVAQAGGSTQDTGRNVVASWTTGWEAYFVPTIAPTGAAFTTVGNAFELTNGFGQRVEQPFYAGIDASRVWGEHAGAEFAPTHVCIPVIIYLGNSA